MYRTPESHKSVTITWVRRHSESIAFDQLADAIQAADA